MSEVSSEITFQIPKDLSPKFKTFFESFDKKLDQLGIMSYGISVTTLEEVFLRVGHGFENKVKDKEEAGSDSETEFLSNQKSSKRSLKY